MLIGFCFPTKMRVTHDRHLVSLNHCGSVSSEEQRCLSRMQASKGIKDSCFVMNGKTIRKAIQSVRESERYIYHVSCNIL